MATVQADATNPGFDVLGNPLVASGVAPMDAQLLSSPCGTGDGAASYVSVADHADFNITNHMTLMCWAKNDTDNLTATNTLIAKWDSGANKREFLLGLTNLEKLQLWSSTDGSSSVTHVADSALATADEWHHYACTITGGTVVLYIDGVAVASTGSGAATIYNSDIPITLGASLSSGAAANFWAGSLCSPRTFVGTSTVFTAAQILAAYQGDDSVPSGQSEVIYMPIDERAGTTVHSVNRGGTKKHVGTWTGATTAEGTGAWAGTQDNFHFAAKYGQSRYLWTDGTDGYLSISNSADFNIGADDSVTMGMWVALGSGATEHYATWRKFNNSTGFSFIKNSDEEGAAVIEDDSANTVSTTGGGTLGYPNAPTWQLVVGVLDRSDDTLSFYIDGALIDSVDASSIGAITNTGVDQDIRIGRLNAAYQSVRGRDFGWWQRAVSAAEISAWYSNKAVPSSPLIHLKLNGNALDSSGNDYDGSVSGTTEWRRIPGNPANAGYDIAGHPVTIPSGKVINPNGVNFTSGIAAPGTANWETAYGFDDARINPKFVRRLVYDTVGTPGVILDGDSDYVTVADNAVFNITDHLSLFCWATIDVADITGSAMLLINKYLTTGDQREFYFGLTTAEKLELQVSDNGTSTAGNILRVTSDAAIAITGEHSYGATFDGGVVKLYVDGVLVASSTTAGSGGLTIFNGTAAVTIGAIANPANYVDGRIRGVQVRNGASGSAVLTAANMLALHNEQEITPTGISKVLHLPFKGNTQDISGNNLNGTLVGTAYFDDPDGYANDRLFAYVETLTGSQAGLVEGFMKSRSA